ncbi:c-type cytochrome biogenesis protein CcsB, partial [Trinickia fusca]
MDLTNVSRPSANLDRAAALFDERPFLRRLGAFDWLFALALVAGAGFALARYHAYMNYYDKAVLLGTVPALVALGWRWKPSRLLMAGIAVFALLSIDIYHGELPRADTAFLLKYFLSSQSAILWMSALFVLATLFYWIGMLSRSPSGG